LQERKKENEIKKLVGTATQKLVLKRRVKDKKTSKNKRTNEERKSRRWKIWSAVFSVIFVMSVLVGVFAIYVLVDTMSNIPDIAQNMNKLISSKNTVVIDKAGNEVADLAESSSVIIDSYEEVPQSLIDAFTATEDARFFKHRGIDGPRTAQAVVGTFILDTGDSGGSTITQQLVKQTLLEDKIALDPGYKNSVRRKIDEWVLAYMIEGVLSKDEILLSYLNNAIGYGRYVGAGTAAKRFFNKKISELTIPEAALLAGIPQLPVHNNPFFDMEKATVRYHSVVDLMERHGYILKEQADLARNTPLADLLMTNQSEFTNENAAYFTAVEEELKEIFRAQGQYTNEKDDNFIYRNFRIYTELVPEQQAFANRIMETEDFVDWSSASSALYGRDMTLEEDYNFQGAFTVIDVKTGGIPAIGASRNIREAGYNIAVRSQRSPGSSIKPIIDYTPAVETFHWGPYQLMVDRPTFYGGGSSEVYNYNREKHQGLISMADAIGKSKNTTAVQAIQQVGLEKAARIASDMGIANAWTRYQNQELGESAALGGGLEVSTKELAAAYATLGNGGVYNKPHTITKIERLEDNKVLWEYKPKPQEVVSNATAATMTEALIHSARTGTMAHGRKQVSRSIQIGGKTGTSSYSSEEIDNYGVSNYAEKDHWHAAYSPTYSIAAWTGLYDEGKEVLERTGGNKNINKAVGSYMLSSWMNEFGDDNAKFDFLNAANRTATKGSIGEFTVSADNKAKRVSWTVPTINLPTGLGETNLEILGGIVYDVTFNTSSGTWNVTTSETQIPYPDGNFNTGSVTVTARLNNEQAAALVDASSVTVSKLVNRKEREKTPPVVPNEKEDEQTPEQQPDNGQGTGSDERTPDGNNRGNGFRFSLATPIFEYGDMFDFFIRQITTLNL